MQVSSHSTPIKFGKAATSADVELLKSQFGEKNVHSALSFSYDAPSQGLFKRDVASLEELAADSLELKTLLKDKGTPSQDVFLVLSKPNAKAKQVQKQVIKHFAEPFAAPEDNIWSVLASMLVGKSFKTDEMKVTHTQDKTIVRLPFQRTGLETAVDLGEGLAAEMRRPAESPRPEGLQKPEAGQ